MLGAASTAQCDPQFTPLLQRAGLDGTANCSVVWDPDGPGPLGERLVVGGTFRVAGGVAANSVAVFDFATGTWSALDTGVWSAVPWPSLGSPVLATPSVRSIAVAPDHSLLVVGRFTHAGKALANNVARWTGSAWLALGNGVSVSGSSAELNDVVGLPNGDVVVCGKLGGAGVSASRWNGSSWSALPAVGSGLVAQGGQALLARQSGAFVLANDESTLGFGVVRQCSIYQWDGSSWTNLGSTQTTGLRECYALAETASGTLLAAGTGFGGSPVRSFDGTSWTTFGTTPLAFTIGSMVHQANGSVVVASRLYETPSQVLSTGSASGPWTSLGTADHEIVGLATRSNGALFAAGKFQSIGGVPTQHVAQWNGSWSGLASAGQDGSVLCAAATPTGFVVGGSFAAIDGMPAQRVAEWDGSAWQPVGSGLPATVVQLVRRSNGDFVARTNAGSTAAPAFALSLWTGGSWSTLVPPAGNPSAMVVLPNDDVAVASSTQVHVWNGSTWSTIPGSFDGQITAIGCDSIGKVVVAGHFSWVGVSVHRIARFDGTTWQPLGSGLGGAGRSIETLAGGELLVAGAFYDQSERYVAAHWTGSSWSMVGTPTREDVPEAHWATREPNGDVIVAGPMLELAGLPVQNLARWSADAWWPIARTAPVTGYARLASGDLLLCGSARIDDTPSGDLFVFRPGCAPTHAAVPTLCIGPGGPMIATALTDAQLGGLLQTQASGFVAGSVAVVVYSGDYGRYQMNLANLMPASHPGCELVPALDIYFILPTSGPVSTVSVALPNVPSLIGAKGYHQFVQVQLDAFGGPFAASSSNALMFRFY